MEQTLYETIKEMESIDRDLADDRIEKVADGVVVCCKALLELQGYLESLRRGGNE